MADPQPPFPVVNPDEASSSSTNGNGVREARYKCLKFTPDDDEIITKFLVPKIQNQNMDFSLIRQLSLGRILSGEEGIWTETKYPHFHKDHYWLFVEREQVVNPVSNLILPQRMIGFGGTILGSWREIGSSAISKGGEVIGLKTTLVFFNSDDQKTGWVQYEYCRNSQAFEDMVVSHLIYDEDLTGALTVFLGNEDFLVGLGHVDVDDLLDPDQ